jgi:RimJ/RimL family protein N-acetyltransferase
MVSDPVGIELQSRHLLLTPIRAEHKQALAELHNDPLVRAAIFEGRPQDEADIERSLSLFLTQWREQGIGFWMVYERADAGRSGPERTDPGNTDTGSTDTGSTNIGSTDTRHTDTGHTDTGHSSAAISPESATDAAAAAAQRKSQAMIGRAGLRHCEFRDALEFGYVFKGSAAGRGLGPEAARLVIAHGIACLKPAQILGFIAPGNQRALSAAFSLGFCMTGEVWREGRSWLALELDQARFAATLGDD